MLIGDLRERTMCSFTSKEEWQAFQESKRRRTASTWAKHLGAKLTKVRGENCYVLRKGTKILGAAWSLEEVEAWLLKEHNKRFPKARLKSWYPLETA